MFWGFITPLKALDDNKSQYQWQLLQLQLHSCPRMIHGIWRHLNRRPMDIAISHCLNGERHCLECVLRLLWFVSGDKRVHDALNRRRHRHSCHFWTSWCMAFCPFDMVGMYCHHSISLHLSASSLSGNPIMIDCRVQVSEIMCTLQPAEHIKNVKKSSGFLHHPHQICDIYLSLASTTLSICTFTGTTNL